MVYLLRIEIPIAMFLHVLLERVSSGVGFPATWIGTWKRLAKMNIDMARNTASFKALATHHRRVIWQPPASNITTCAAVDSMDVIQMLYNIHPV